MLRRLALLVVLVIALGCQESGVGVGIGVNAPYGAFGPFGAETVWVGGPVLR